MMISNNIVKITGTAGRGIAITGTATNPVVNGNQINMTGGVARTGIDFGTVTTAICSGNRMINGTINVTAGTVWGVVGGGGPTNLNYLT